MKVIVTSPFRAGNTWLAFMLSRILDVATEPLPLGSLAALPDNKVYSSNRIVNADEVEGAIVIRMIRNVADSVAAKLLYGVSHYIPTAPPVTENFQAFLNAVSLQSPIWRNDHPAVVTLAVNQHKPLVGQFIHENLKHLIAPSEGITCLTFEELCFNAEAWLTQFVTNNALTVVRPVRGVTRANTAHLAMDRGLLCLAVSNWCSANLSVSVYRELDQRIEMIEAKMRLEAQAA